MLLIDAGNSRLKWAQLINGRLQGAGSTLTRSSKQSPQEWHSLPRPSSILAVSVREPRFNSWLKQAARSIWDQEVIFVRPRPQACGVVNGYRQPEHLGADRWVALIGAQTLTTAATCVVDAGTAVTIDLIDSEGRHLGGCIVPGLDLMGQALRRGTFGARADTPRRPAAAQWGLNTSEAIAAGGVQAVVGLVERQLAALRQRCGSSAECIVTGGDAELLLPWLGPNARHDPLLLFRGLARLAGLRFEIIES